MRALFLAAGLLASSVAQAAPVQVRISNVTGAKGDLYVALCTEQEFLKRCPLRRRVSATPGETVVVFQEVRPGRYAASVFQDVDGNGRLTLGMMGAPSEPWGMSRGAKGVFGPPNFADAVVEVGDHGAVIPVRLSH